MPRRTEPAAAESATFTTDELLQLANAASPDAAITARTLRYYASLQLIDPPASRQGQPARYTQRHLDQLAAVRRRREAGRGLAEIAAEFAAAAHPGAAAAAAVGGAARRTAVVLPAPLAMPQPQPQPLTEETARSVLIAPGVQVVLTGAALADVGLVARLTAAARGPEPTHPHTPRTAHTPRKTGAH